MNEKIEKILVYIKRNFPYMTKEEIINKALFTLQKKVFVQKEVDKSQKFSAEEIMSNLKKSFPYLTREEITLKALTNMQKKSQGDRVAKSSDENKPLETEKINQDKPKQEEILPKIKQNDTIGLDGDKI